MTGVESYNGVADTWPKVVDHHHGVPGWPLALIRVLGNGLSATMPLVAVICPLYVLLDIVLRDFHPPLGPISCLALVGTGACFIYLPFHLTCPPERRLWMTTALLIGFGFVAGLVGVWFST
jgi:hypothetical protein